MQSRKDTINTKALVDSSSKVDAMHPAFAKKLGLAIQETDVSAQKIDGTTLETYKMVIVAFSMTDKAEKVCFFEETFLLANVSMISDVVLEMPFLTLSNADVNFPDWELLWRSYTTLKALPTTELIGKKEFAAIAKMRPL